MTLTSIELLLSVSEPTRLRILNCLAAAPLFVSDLQAVLEIPQPTVSRHLALLRHADVVRDTPVGQFVLYRLRREDSATARILRAILDALRSDPTLRLERDRAIERSRTHTRHRQTAVQP